VLAVVVIANLILWVVARPGGQPGPRYFGELLGAEAVLQFTCSLILATLLPVIERAFGGLDRVAQWHRHTAVAAVVLIIVHPAFAGSTPVPDVTQVGLAFGSLALLGLVVLSVWALALSLKAARWSKIVQRLAALSHERWLTGHRLTGLFAAAAVVHAVMVDPVLRESAILKVTYLVVGLLGITAYLYRELLARFGLPIYDYIAAVVSRPNDSTIDAFVEPASAAIFLDEIKRPPQPTRSCDRPLSTPARTAFSLPTSWSPACRPTRRPRSTSAAPRDDECNGQRGRKPGHLAQTDPVGTIQHPLTTIEVGRT